MTSKKCTKCNNVFDLSNFYTTGKKVSGEPKYNSWCKKCILEKQSLYHKQTWGEDKLKYTSFKRTKSVKSYLSYLRAKALGRKKDDNINIDYLISLWDKQNGKCALTGWGMTMVLGEGVIQTNCSIDRIDSSIGYVEGNIQLVCRIVNISKSNTSVDNFINLCKSVVDFNNKQNG